MKAEGTTLVVVRFGLLQKCTSRSKMSLEGGKTRPFNYCFAGVDKDDAALQHMFPFPPSSPSMALFKKRRISTHARASPH
jgi:putative YphP/YqiW family bacilliredoxin